MKGDILNKIMEKDALIRLDEITFPKWTQGRSMHWRNTKDEVALNKLNDGGCPKQTKKKALPLRNSCQTCMHVFVGFIFAFPHPSF